MSKVYHVEMKEPIDGKKHFYFGSQIAIFEVLSVKQVGISYKALSNKYRLANAPYENKRCTIRLGELVRKKLNEANHPNSFLASNREFDYSSSTIRFSPSIRS